MRNKITALIFLGVFFMTKTTAQDTTFTRISTETGTLEQQTVETETDRLFGVKTPARWMVNIGLKPYYPVYNNFINDANATPPIGIEVKISPSFSTGLKYGYGWQSGGGIFAYDAHIHTLQLEQRWYPQMAKKIQAGTGANNFSGTYLGLRTGVQYIFQNEWTFRDDLGNVYTRGGNYVNQWQTEIRYGIQSRIRKHGLFDYSAGLTFNHYPNIQNSTQQSASSIGLNQEFRIGLALFERSEKTDYSGSYCGVLRCFDDNRRMFKVNTLNLLNVFYQKYSQSNLGFAIKPNIAVEQKFGSAPFSVEAETDVNFTNGSLNDKATIFRAYSLSGAAGLRWYYNQPKRIAAGRAGNNLSGPFLAVRGKYEYSANRANILNAGEQKTITNSQTLHLLWGYQLRIFKHGYAAFRIGPGYYQIGGDIAADAPKWGLDIFSDLKVGFAF